MLWNLHGCGNLLFIKAAKHFFQVSVISRKMWLFLNTTTIYSLSFNPSELSELRKRKWEQNYWEKTL